MTQRKKQRFTKTERSWILYDWANSAYATIIMAAIFPIYFANVTKSAGVSGDVWWGYGSSIATLTVAILAPVLGAIADFHGMKKKFLATFLGIGLVFTTLMALTDNWQWMLVGYVFSYIGFSGSLLFYDAFITDVTTPARMDKVSAWGYAMGYLGGSTIPFILSIALIMFGSAFGIGGALAVKISVIICVLWWSGFSIPILRNVQQVHSIEMPAKALIGSALKGIARTAHDIFANKSILVFMLAYFFYIDGVNTVIHMATVYGSTLGLDSTGMILALLVTQVVAVPFSIAFGRLAKRFGSINMITAAILIYIVICIVGFYMGITVESGAPGAVAKATQLFWAMAVLVGTSQGGIQALSRSFFGKLIPPARSNEFFGFFDIFGKFAAVMGPAIYAFFAHSTGRSSSGILALVILFVIGLVIIALGRKQLAAVELLAAQAELKSERQAEA
ncbi:MAG: MFS transporter [Eubacteriales bacterium]|nr:MFS transporter [Eubacteriales bacterium]